MAANPSSTNSVKRGRDLGLCTKLSEGGGGFKEKAQGVFLAPLSPFFSPCRSPWSHTCTHPHTHTHKHWRGLSLAMATTTTEESSPVPATIAPQKPDLESSVEPGSAAKPEPSEAQHDREEKEEEEEEEGGPGQENARGKSLDPEWVEERFRIDRKKLENMLYGECTERCLSSIVFHWHCYHSHTLIYKLLFLKVILFWCLPSSQPVIYLTLCVCQGLQLAMSLLSTSL